MKSGRGGLVGGRGKTIKWVQTGLGLSGVENGRLWGDLVDVHRIKNLMDQVKKDLFVKYQVKDASGSFVILVK